MQKYLKYFYNYFPDCIKVNCVSDQNWYTLLSDDTKLIPTGNTQQATQNAFLLFTKAHEIFLLKISRGKNAIFLSAPFALALRQKNMKLQGQAVNMDFSIPPYASNKKKLAPSVK